MNMEPLANLRPHLKELQRRVLISFITIAVASGGAYLFAEPISQFLMAPLFASQADSISLIYTNLTEAFITYLKMALLVGIIVSFPVLLYQIWRFMAPGLTTKERRVIFLGVFWGSLLFGSGVCFAYFVVMPKVLGFFMGFASENLEPLPKLGGYLTFVARSSLAFGLAFEIPFLMVVAAKTGLVVRDYFAQHRKYYYIGLLVLAFLLCAGDIMGTALLALPLAGLYEAGILVTRTFTPAPKPAGV